MVGIFSPGSRHMERHLDSLQSALDDLFPAAGIGCGPAGKDVNRKPVQVTWNTFKIPAHLCPGSRVRNNDFEKVPDMKLAKLHCLVWAARHERRTGVLDLAGDISPVKAASCCPMPWGIVSMMDLYSGFILFKRLDHLP